MRRAIAGAHEVPAGDGWLGPRERAVLARLHHGPRRESWRLGRFAAKRLLGSDVEVLAEPGGAPRAWRGDTPVAGCVSLSHRDGLALAAAVPAGALGCDLERIEERSEAFVGDYFTPAEQAWVAAARPRGLDVVVDGAALRVRDLEEGREWRGMWWTERGMVATLVHCAQAWSPSTSCDGHRQWQVPPSRASPQNG